MNVFAQGKRALAICDRCGFTYDLNKLVDQVVDTRPTGLLVCRECNDKDHPQLQLGKFPINDPIALRNARPDISPGDGLFGWAPVGNDATRIIVRVGTIHVRPA